LAVQTTISTLRVASPFAFLRVSKTEKIYPGSEVIEAMAVIRNEPLNQAYRF
jgi:hypothetical protein